MWSNGNVFADCNLSVKSQSRCAGLPVIGKEEKKRKGANMSTNKAIS